MEQLNLDEIYCPGCARQLLHDNDGCPLCEWGIDSGVKEKSPFHIPPLRWFRDENEMELNDVSCAFIAMLLGNQR